mgnify:CR=1 FL=1
MEGEYLTSAQAARRLHMSAATVAKKLSDGRMAGGVKVGRQWLIKKEAVDALLAPPASQG